MSEFTKFPIPNINIPALPDVSPVTDASQFIMERAGTGRVSASAVSAYVAADVAPRFSGNVGRNLLHNGLFNVQQRTQGPWATTNVYTADRWVAGINLDTSSFQLNAIGIGALGTSDQSAKWQFSCLFTGNAGDAAVTLVSQRIEDVRRLANQTVTVSFTAWTGGGSLKLGVSLDQNFGTGGSPSALVSGAGQTITATTTPTRYSLTFTIPSAAGKALGSNANDFTQLNFWYSSGANYTAPSGGVGVQAGNIAMWGVQLEIGSVATPLEKPDPQADQANCQRFYFGTSTPLNISFYTGQAGSFFSYPVYSAVAMRAAPTVALGTGSANTNISAVNVIDAGASGFQIQAVAVAAGMAGVVINGYSMSADL